jgi:ATP-dependent Clp protease ATP-binding subunit ClpX
LIKFGLIPEFVGRLPVLVPFEGLTEDDLTKIITEPKSSILKQYRDMLMSVGVELSIEPEAIRAIAKEALHRKTGARGIRSLMEEILFKAVYKIDGKKYKINIEEDIINKTTNLHAKR